jgi:hypothetical protein
VNGKADDFTARQRELLYLRCGFFNILGFGVAHGLDAYP